MLKSPPLSAVICYVCIFFSHRYIVLLAICTRAAAAWMRNAIVAFYHHPDIRCMDVLWTHDPKCRTCNHIVRYNIGAQSHLIKPPKKKKQTRACKHKKNRSVCAANRHNPTWSLLTESHKFYNYTRTPDRLYSCNMCSTRVRENDLQYKATALS